MSDVTNPVGETKTIQDLKVVKLGKFVKLSGFVQVIPKVRVNANNYPFLTFINADNEATNIYFSREEGAKRTVNEELDNEYLISLKVAYDVKDSGEIYHKLTTGNSLRKDLNFFPEEDEE